MTRTNHPRHRARVVVASALLLAVCAGCGATDHDADTEQLAQRLVDATSAAGVAPNLTVETAAALYGNEAPGVCRALAGGLSTSAKNALLGNLALGRRKTITDDAVTFGGLVVEVYCPQYTDRYDALVDDLEPFERTDG